MLKEFKTFISRGNAVDMAVAFIMGGAFGKIVSSLVEDILMPPLGMLLGKVDFSALYLNLSGVDYPTLAAAREAGAAVISYGVFINAAINFVIVSFALFLIVRAFNRMKRAEPAPVGEPTTRACPFCLSEIPRKATKCAHCTADVPQE